MKLYNTLTRKKQVFKPIKKGHAKIYTCGPTVYDYAHIGNLRSYIFADILHRALEYDGYKVKHVINITDVGHLVSDSDEGEDKIERAAKRQKKSAWDIAHFFEAQFKKDIKELNIIFPDKFVRATDHIKEQIALIKKLEEKGYTYKTSDGIYFDTSRLKDYGKLSGQKAEEKLAGARVKMGEKKHITDFALWKFSPPFPPSCNQGGGEEGDFFLNKTPHLTSPRVQGEEYQRRQMEWSSPWGKGFPGWHIECSAMSKKYLGQPFDIHTGGIDHISVHHTNEIAQSEAAYNKPLANFWLHNEFVVFGKEKLSKSKGNSITLNELQESGYHPLAYRYLCLQTHYKKQLNFSEEALGAAQIALNKLYGEARVLSAPKGECAKLEKEFKAAIEDDLNTPKALGIVWDMLKSNCAPGAKLATLLKFDKVLGLGVDKNLGKKVVIPEKIKKLNQERQEARKKKDWKIADKLRGEIEKMGYEIEDTSTGAKLLKK
ncbi:cysteine--tRNA ligase [Candidatus Parcubacteria bacterium]|nr:cysteine--tRNA ligase [Candidatus Parcubacteria bacterium]